MSAQHDGPIEALVGATPGVPATDRPAGTRSLAIRAENVFATAALGGIMLLPLAEIATRRVISTGIPGSAPFTLNLTLWVGLLGAAIAARDGKLLTLATGEFLPKRLAGFAHLVGGAVGAAIAAMFAVGGIGLVLTERTAGDTIALSVPVWVSALAFPIGFTLIALRLGLKASPNWAGRIVAAVAIVAGAFAAVQFDWFEGQALLPWMVAILIAGVLGAPI